ncbi:hypothetical protein [Terrabacter carboxydivorans]|uniref:hypothetical protein n=1 Tax=Terrabacter carboxydivorans TaxID=619730 RepID=UPI0031D0C455
MPTPRRKPPAAKTVSTPARPSRRRPPAAEPDDAIVLAGPPGRLTTTVTVENVSADRLVVRRPTLHLGGEAVTGAASAIIPGGRTVEVPVVVPLPATTPPGRHEAEMELGGVRRRVVVDVAPHPALELSPRRVLAVEGSQDVTLVVTNTGNVRMPLAALTMARADDGGPDPGPDVVLALEAPAAVEPGQTVTLPARLEVPPGLDPARRHTASVPVGIADLDVVILPRDRSESKS